MNDNNDENLVEENSNEEQNFNNEYTKNSLEKPFYGSSISKSMQRTLESIAAVRHSYMKALTPILKQQEWMNAITEPMRELQTKIETGGLDLINSSMSNYYQGITRNMAKSMKTLMGSYTPLISESIKNFVASYKFDIAQRIQSPVQQMLQGIDFSPLYSILESLKGIDFSKYKEKLNRIIITETYEAKWFPHVYTDQTEHTARRFSA